MELHPAIHMRVSKILKEVADRVGLHTKHLLCLEKLLACVPTNDAALIPEEALEHVLATLAPLGGASTFTKVVAAVVSAMGYPAVEIAGPGLAVGQATKRHHSTL